MATKEGYTPIMICCIYKSNEALKMLLKYGGIYLQSKDNNGKTAIELGKKYGNAQCEDIINDVFKGNDYLDFLEMKMDQLSQFPELDILISDSSTQPEEDLTDVDKIQYRELLVQGELLPCVICLSNLGFIKYTTCCGQPGHTQCFTNQAKKVSDVNCPICNSTSCKLTCIVRFPERAF